MEILNYGIGAPNLVDGANGTVCADPTPNAILRLQRLRTTTWTWRPSRMTSRADANLDPGGVVWPSGLRAECAVRYARGLVRDVDRGRHEPARSAA